jgi:acyl dehydratase
VGVSGWHEVTQEQINLFAQATGDHQWIHVDPERAARESPYGRAIAHGFLTLSLIPALRAEIVEVVKKRMTINYGLNKVRFPAAVPVGSRVRMRAFLSAVEDVKGGVQATWTFTIEVEGQDKPACVAESLLRYLAP